MEMSIKKLTDESLMQRACAFTRGAETAKTTLKEIYECGHSPMRTQLFWIEITDLPTYVSVHLVRHNVGVTHFVQSNRDKEDITRETPVNHAMLVNAEAIINMSRKRLCGKASAETRAVFQMLRVLMDKVDSDLAWNMMPECIYRGGRCHEPKPCGRYNREL